MEQRCGNIWISYISVKAVTDVTRKHNFTQLLFSLCSHTRIRLWPSREQLHYYWVMRLSVVGYCLLEMKC